MKRLHELIIWLLLIICMTACNEADISPNVVGDKEPIVLGYSLRSVTNPYYVYAIEGLEGFVGKINDDDSKSHYIDYHLLEYDNSDEQQIKQIKQLIAMGGKNTIIIADANHVENVYEINRICEEAQVYFATIWTKPDDLNPADHPYYVMHLEMNDMKAGYDVAIKLFETLEENGESKIIAIQADEQNDASNNRFNGFKQALALHPEIELLDIGSAYWDPHRAYEYTKDSLEKYDTIDGIWVGNDMMARGVIDALTEKGLNQGEITTVGIDGVIPESIKNGDLLVSVSLNPWEQLRLTAETLYYTHVDEENEVYDRKEGIVILTDAIMLTKYNVESFIENKGLDKE